MSGMITGNFEALGFWEAQVWSKTGLLRGVHSGGGRDGLMPFKGYECFLEQDVCKID